MMPLLYLNTDEVKKEISSNMVAVLETFTSGNPKAPRMKPLDVVKVLMGIRSERDCVKQFMQDGKFFGQFQEYDYEQLTTLADTVVQKWYLDNIEVLDHSSKRQKPN